MFVSVTLTPYFTICLATPHISTDLGYAARNGDMTTMHQICNNYNTEHLNLDSALCLSSSYNNLAEMRYLISKGAKNTETALVCAALRNQLDAVRFLVCKERCKIPAINLEEAISLAKDSGSVEVEKYLRMKLAPPDVVVKV